MTIKWCEQVPEKGLSENQAIRCVMANYLRGYSLSTLAKFYKVSSASIRNLMVKINVTRRSVGGRNNYKPLNITKEEYLETNLRTLAKKYNVSTSTINRYRKEKGWRKGDKNVSI